jgi:hypothetical protein
MGDDSGRKQILAKSPEVYSLLVGTFSFSLFVTEFERIFYNFGEMGYKVLSTFIEIGEWERRIID